MIRLLHNILRVLYRVKHAVSYLLAFSAGYVVGLSGVSLPSEWLHSFFDFLL